MGDSLFAGLIDRLRDGDDDAVRVVLDRFSQQLLRLAQGRLGAVLRVKEDPEDVVQSVYRSFFRRHRDGEFQIENWESLWGLLSLLTLRKIARRAEFYQAKKRDAGQEVPLASGGESDAAGWVAAARDPGPEESAILVETIEELLQPLSASEQEMVRLRLAGHSTAEIGQTVGRSQFTVQAVLRRSKRRLERLINQPD